MSDTIITGAAIQHAEIARLIGALSLQAKGIKVTRHSAIAAAARWSGSDARVSKRALEDLVVWYYQQGGQVSAQWGGIKRALGDERCGKLERKCHKIISERKS